MNKSRSNFRTVPPIVTANNGSAHLDQDGPINLVFFLEWYLLWHFWRFITMRKKQFSVKAVGMEKETWGY